MAAEKKKSSRKPKVRQAEIVRLFSKRLRELRMAAGMTQHELARKAHINLAYMGQLERGRTAPGIDTAGRIAEALGISPARLFPGDVDEPLPDLQEKARVHFEAVLKTADRETLLVLTP